VKPKIAGFQLVSHTIRSLSFEIRGELKEVSLKPDLDLIPKYEIRRKDERLSGELCLGISYNLKSGKKIIIAFKAIITGLFVSTRNMQEEEFERFIKYSGTPMLIQMARGLLISISAEAGLTPPIIIPMINSTTCFEEK